MNFPKDEKCSTEKDLNLHPWLSGPSALLLDHQRYFLFLPYSSQLRAYCLVQDLIKLAHLLVAIFI